MKGFSSSNLAGKVRRVHEAYLIFKIRGEWEVSVEDGLLVLWGLQESFLECPGKKS